MRTLIKGGTIIAFEGGEHKILLDGEVVIEGDKVIYVGHKYEDSVDMVMDCRNKIVFPGLINTHIHMTDTPFTKGYSDERNPQVLKSPSSGLYLYLPTIRKAISEEDELVAVRFALLELLKTGTTTAVELGLDTELMHGGNIEQTKETARIAGEMGLRVYLGPRFKSGHFYADSLDRVKYEWYHDEGMRRLSDCINFAKDYDGKFNGRIKTLLAPAQVDTCSPKLLRKTREVANETGLRIELHLGQSRAEFFEMVLRHQCSPVKFLETIGFLGKDVIIGHGLFISHHSSVKYDGGNDLDILSKTGTHIAHCPWVLGRIGFTLETYMDYVEKGINVSLGTDTFPLNIIQEARAAMVFNRITEKSPFVARARDLFNSLTLSGARALDRDDLGKIAVNCKADMIILNQKTISQTPMRDPIRNIIYSASPDDIDKVIIDGNVLVDGGKAIYLNEQKIIDDMQEAAERVWKRVENMDKLSPISLSKYE